MGFVVIQFFVAVGGGAITSETVNWFTLDIGKLAGTCSLGMVIHPVVLSFCKENADQSKNVRNVGIAYTLGPIIYLTVSVMGAFAVSEKDPSKCKDVLVNCYITDWTVLFVSVTYFLGRVGAFPIML